MYDPISRVQCMYVLIIIFSIRITKIPITIVFCRDLLCYIHFNNSKFNTIKATLAQQVQYPGQTYTPVHHHVRPMIESLHYHQGCIHCTVSNHWAGWI